MLCQDETWLTVSMWHKDMIRLRTCRYAVISVTCHAPLSWGAWRLRQLRFEGINLDPGLTDYGARYYAPAFGRWTSPDPLADKYYSVSPYAFCGNNPVNFVDPDGRFYGDPVRNPDIRRNRASNLMGKGIRILHNKPRNHQGFDYYAPLGTEVLTVKDGIVVQSGGIMSHMVKLLQ